MRFVIGASMFVLFFSSLPVRAGYLMDCSKASTKIEKQICANRELWHLDGLLNRHYAAAIARGGDLEELRRGQRRWLREVRDHCDSDHCLRKVYEARLDFLERWEFSDPYCEERTYPPYPDVWGYEPGQYGASFVSLYGLPTGEAWVRYGEAGREERFIKCVFGGEQVQVRKEVGAGYAAYKSILSLTLGGHRLPDGSTLVRGALPSGAHCTSGYGGYLEKKNSRGKVEKRITFLVPLSKPKEMPVGGCEGAPPGRNTVTTFVSNASATEVAVLADGSILVIGGSLLYPFVIRFDKDLNTKFHSERILVVNFDDIYGLHQISSDYQDLANRVFQYVKEKIQEGY